MSTLPIPSTLFATRRVSLRRSRLVALAVAVAAAFEALLLGPAGIDAAAGIVRHPRARA